MYRLYKDGKECTCMPIQLAVMLESGWSQAKPEKKAETKPVDKKVSR